MHTRRSRRGARDPKPAGNAQPLNLESAASLWLPASKSRRLAIAQQPQCLRRVGCRGAMPLSVSEWRPGRPVERQIVSPKTSRARLNYRCGKCGHLKKGAELAIGGF